MDAPGPLPDAVAVWRALMTSTSADPLPDVLNLFRPPAWHADADCRDAPTEVFFPRRGQSATPARAICAGCPVSADCLAWSLDQDDELAGIWAGTTAAQRRALRRDAA